jgi:hypothetical protein
VQVLENGAESSSPGQTWEAAAKNNENERLARLVGHRAMERNESVR